MTKPKPKDEQALAEQAADEFLAVLEAHVDGEPVDVDQACMALSAALAPVAPRPLVEEVLSAGRGLLAYYASNAKLATATIASLMARSRLHLVRAALDRALVRFDRQDELDVAERELADLEAQQRAALAALERAVVAVDVESVMRLRGDVEVGFPGRVGQARLAVLDLQLARAGAESALPVRRCEEVAAAVKQAEAEVAEVEQRAARARARLSVAQADREAAAEAERAAQRRVEQLRADRERLAGSLEGEQQARLRRLAGLPEAPGSVVAAGQSTVLVGSGAVAAFGEDAGGSGGD